MRELSTPTQRVKLLWTECFSVLESLANAGSVDAKPSVQSSRNDDLSCTRREDIEPTSQSYMFVCFDSERRLPM
jgi:hypothetical protein